MNRPKQIDWMPLGCGSKGHKKTNSTIDGGQSAGLSASRCLTNTNRNSRPSDFLFSQNQSVRHSNTFKSSIFSAPEPPKASSRPQSLARAVNNARPEVSPSPRARNSSTFRSSILPSSSNQASLNHTITSTYRESINKSAEKTLQRSATIRNVLRTGQKEGESIASMKMQKAIDSHRPSDRLFKELYGKKATGVNGKNSRKTTNDSISSSNQTWSQHQNRIPARSTERISFKERRAMHYDSSLWGEERQNSASKWTAKKQSRISSDTHYTHHNGEATKDNRERAFDAFSNYVKDTKSSALPLTNFDSFTPVKKEYIPDQANDTQRLNRSMNRNHSDLFGRDLSHPKFSGGTKRTSQYASTVSWTDTRTENAKDKTPNLSASAKKSHELASKRFSNRDFDIISNNERSYSRTAEKAESISKRYEPELMKGRELEGSLVIEEFDPVRPSQREELISKKETKPEVVELELSGLPEDTDIQKLREMSPAKHIITAETKQNNLKGTCTGKGSITIRSNTPDEREKIIQSFKAHGVKAKSKVRRTKKERNYLHTTQTHWLDSATAIETAKEQPKLQERNNNLNHSMTSYPQTTKNRRREASVTKIGERGYLREKELREHCNNENKTPVQKLKLYESKPELYGNTNRQYKESHLQEMSSNHTSINKQRQSNEKQNLSHNSWKTMDRKLAQYKQDRESRVATTKRISSSFMQPTRSSKLKRSKK